MATGSGYLVLVCFLLSFLTVAESTETFVDNCGQTYDLHLDEDEVSFDLMFNVYVGNNVSCDITFVTSPDHMIVFVFDPDVIGCAGSLYAFEDYIYPLNELSPNLCDVAHQSVFVTGSNVGIVELRSSVPGDIGAYHLQVSTFTYTDYYGDCQDGYSKCDNSRCIKTSQVCNGRNNCGDNSDENWDCSFPLWAILLIVAGVLGVIICVVVFIIIIVKSSHVKQMKNKRVSVIQPTQGVTFHSMQQGPFPSHRPAVRPSLPTIQDTPNFLPHPGSPPPPVEASSVAPPSSSLDNVPPPPVYLEYSHVPGPAVYNLPPAH